MDDRGGRGQRIAPFAGGIRRAARSGGLRRCGRRRRRCSRSRRVSCRSRLERCSTDRRGRRRVSRASRRTCSSRVDRDHAAYSMRSQELAYLANTIVAGCSIQARPFTAQEASDAAVAVCNLGLENWPPHWLPAEARRGSSARSRNGAARRLSRRSRPCQRVPGRVDGPPRGVCMYAAEQLIRRPDPSAV